MAKQKGKGKPAASKDPIAKELEAIKRLLMLSLLKEGVAQNVIALALQMDPADLSRMMPVRKIKKAVSS